MIRLHPREIVISQAQIEIDLAVSELIKKHGLTFGEVFRILGVLVQSSARYLIREERHGDQSVPGGVVDQ